MERDTKYVVLQRPRTQHNSQFSPQIIALTNIRFYHGKRVKGFHCVWCDSRRKGRIKREMARWLITFDCGHHRILGWVKHPEVLTAEGLLNAPTKEEKEKAERNMLNH